MNTLPKLTDFELKLLKWLYPKDTMILHDIYSKRTYFYEENCPDVNYNGISLFSFDIFVKNKLIEMRWATGPFTGWRLTLDTKKILQDILDKENPPIIGKEKKYDG